MNSKIYSIESINARSKVLKGENMSFTKMAKTIVTQEGPAALYKGYSASFYSIITHGFLYFYLYKGIKVFMKDHFQAESTMAKAAIYALSATLAQTVDVVCYPMEMIRVRLLTNNDVYKYRSVSDAMIKIVRQDTWRGLYQGGSSYFVNLVGQYSVSLTLYELIMDAALKRHGQSAFKQNETWHVI